MEKKIGSIKDEKTAPRQIGSNLTGTALRGKPGHERDIDTKTFEEIPEKEEQPDDHIENSDVLLGDVHPTHRKPKSQEQYNADQES